MVDEETPAGVVVEAITARDDYIDNDESPREEEISNDQPGDAASKKIHMRVDADAPWSERMWEVFTTFWPLGFVAFGGPQAHVAILRDHLVVQRDWLDEEQFTELFAIGQVGDERESEGESPPSPGPLNLTGAVLPNICIRTAK